jgi:hypothetical protein
MTAAWLDHLLFQDTCYIEMNLDESARTKGFAGASSNVSLRHPITIVKGAYLKSSGLRKVHTFEACQKCSTGGYGYSDLAEPVNVLRHLLNRMVYE